jgi:hypothetical protein
MASEEGASFTKAGLISELEGDRASAGWRLWALGGEPRAGYCQHFGPHALACEDSGWRDPTRRVGHPPLRLSAHRPRAAPTRA